MVALGPAPWAFIFEGSGSFPECNMTLLRYFLSPLRLTLLVQKHTEYSERLFCTQLTIFLDSCAKFERGQLAFGSSIG